MIAARSDLVAGVTRLIDAHVAAFQDGATGAERARQPFVPDDLGERPPEQIAWYELSAALETDPSLGFATWERIVAAAEDELNRGTRAARALETGQSGPWDRARFAALLRELTHAVAPRSALERLLVQQMAVAWSEWLHWQQVATERMISSQWNGERDRRNALSMLNLAERERAERDEGWMPPRLSDAEAISHATTLADRHQRAFQRAVRAFRDLRRFSGMLVVTGGQVNIGDQQVNLVGERGTPT